MKLFVDNIIIHAHEDYRQIFSFKNIVEGCRMLCDKVRSHYMIKICYPFGFFLPNAYTGTPRTTRNAKSVSDCSLGR